jgi:hypothetical protein
MSETREVYTHGAPEPPQTCYEGPKPGSILPCHACGTPGRVVRRNAGGGKFSLTYEPLALDALALLDSPELLEILADIEHERWAGWESYRREKAGLVHPSGDSYLHRWYRQEATPYFALTEAEKESDRIEARKGLAAVRKYLAARAQKGEGT